MKKTVTALLLSLIAASSAFAVEDIQITGEIKTGFLFEKRDEGGETTSYARINNNDGDAGASEGRIRIGIAFELKNIGIRTKFYQDNFRRGTGSNDPNLLKLRTEFAYGYGGTFNNQLKISAGLLGESPWGTGGPDLYQELEYSGGAPIMGIRVEWKPLGILRGLNLGFVLNRSDEGVPWDAKEQFGDLFKESIVGIAWEHKYFAFRFAYRFDRDVKSDAVFVTGEKFVYRVEERVLWQLLPGMQIWANGYCEGINSENRGSGYGPPGYIQNWFYAHYDSRYFNVGIDAGYRDNFVKKTGQVLEIRPSFYYKFINNYLVAGVMGGLVMGFNGSESYPDVFYNNWYLEPQVKVNFHNNFYIAFVYRYTSNAYQTLDNNDYYTQWFNMRLCYTF
ncbi:hypothetical protein R84B8_01084 [Treponema sp. R8-4-B8]